MPEREDKEEQLTVLCKVSEFLLYWIDLEVFTIPDSDHIMSDINPAQQMWDIEKKLKYDVLQFLNPAPT